MQFVNQPFDAHFYTFSCFQRRPFLRSPRLKEYLAEGIQQARARHAFHLWAYVFMPEHVHLLIWFPHEAYGMSSVAKSIKQSVARRAIAYVRSEKPEALVHFATGLRNPAYRFWQDGSGYDRNVSVVPALRSMVEYMHENPVRRKLALNASDWEWSSWSAWHSGVDTPLSIDRESFPIC